MARSPLADEACLEIRAAIVDGRLAAGRPIGEDELAAQLGVSRTPTRMALRRLELEGYLERDARGRLLVHGLSAEELGDLFLVRSRLEAYAARLAAERISDDELQELEQLVQWDLGASTRTDFGELADLNDRLHGLVLRAARNRTLVETVTDLRRRVFGLSAFAVGSPEDRHDFVEDHAELLWCIRDGDGSGAERVVVAHLGRARDLLLEGIEDARIRRPRVAVDADDAPRRRWCAVIDMSAMT